MVRGDIRGTSRRNVRPKILECGGVKVLVLDLSNEPRHAAYLSNFAGISGAPLQSCVALILGFHEMDGRTVGCKQRCTGRNTGRIL